MQLTSLLFITSASALRASLASMTTLGRDPQGSARLNGMSFQQDALVSHNGYQYAAFYSATEQYNEQYVTLARRNISSGAEWEAFNFTDYKQTTQDPHNTISLGVSPSGRIHLAYDHHDVPLNYRISEKEVARDPKEYTWGPKLCGETVHELPGNTERPLDSVTYPRFETVGDEFLFELREGQSGNGDSYIYKYRPASGTWELVNRYLHGNNNNGYINGISSRENNIFASFTWRDTSHVTSNHDLMYASSSDYGKTWTNSAGESLGSELTPDSQGLTVYSLPESSGGLNQEAQGIDDSNGRLFVLNRQFNTKGTLTWMLYMRDTDGSWDRTPSSHNLGNLTQTGHRGKLAVTASGDVLAILPSDSDNKLAIYGATAAISFGDWTELWTSEGYDVDPLYDCALWKSEGDNVLSIFACTSNSYPQRAVRVLDFVISE